jgi:hypothetical protein
MEIVNHMNKPIEFWIRKILSDIRSSVFNMVIDETYASSSMEINLVSKNLYFICLFIRLKMKITLDLLMDLWKLK